MKKQILSEEVLRMKRLANIISENQYVEELNENINDNPLYRDLMDVLSSSNASRKEKEDILGIILKELEVGQKQREYSIR